MLDEKLNFKQDIDSTISKLNNMGIYNNKTQI